jgi:hypothetical protein
MKVNGEYRLEDAAEFFERKDVDEFQSCFDYTVFCLARDQYLAPSFSSDALLTVFSETQTGIKNYFSHFLTKTPKREKAIATFLEMISPLRNTEQEDSAQQEKSKEKLLQLAKNSECIRDNK